MCLFSMHVEIVHLQQRKQRRHDVPVEGRDSGVRGLGLTPGPPAWELCALVNVCGLQFPHLENRECSPSGTR